jgi:hypothetical protein
MAIRACSFAHNRADSGEVSGPERDEEVAADPRRVSWFEATIRRRCRACRSRSSRSKAAPSHCESQDHGASKGGKSSPSIGQAEKVRAPRFLATPDDLGLFNRRQSDSNPRLLGRARNADVPLVRHRIGDDPTGRRLAVRGLRSRRRARDADVLLLRHGIGFRTAGRCLAVGGLRSRRRARNADILLFRHRISHGSAGRRGR